MESAAVLRSFHYAVTTSSPLKTVLEKPGMLTMNNGAFSNLSKLPVCGGKIVSCTNRRRSIIVSCVKSSDTTVPANANSDPDGAVLSNGVPEKKSSSSATFPNHFEALLTEVCDKTKIAELKLKYGAYEIHMKRNVDGPTITAPVVPVVPQATAPPVPIKQANESTSGAPPPSSKSSAEKVTPFTDIPAEKAARLAALELFGSCGYVIVSSPAVGSFRRATTLQKEKQPLACKEGDVIEEGQVIGFLGQLDSEVAIKSNVAGEVLKFLYNDGEGVAYGDPLVAILPSFHDVK